MATQTITRDLELQPTHTIELGSISTVELPTTKTMDITIVPDYSNPTPTILTLPTELRIQILDYVFAANASTNGLIPCPKTRTTVLDESYKPALDPLLTCRQFYTDGVQVAWLHTHFLITSLYSRPLPPKQTLRSLGFVADARHFRQMVEWNGSCPFGRKLETLTIVLHRSSFWHYLFDFTSDLVRMLRSLQGVKRVIFVRNQAQVKGGFRAWCNRLAAGMLKVDFHARYESLPVRLERCWWVWRYEEVGQRFVLEAREPRGWVGMEQYLEGMQGVLEELRRSVEMEEWNPDPRARNGA